MIVLGLFHGIVVLPTALSLVSPNAYSHYIDLEKDMAEDDNENNIKPLNGSLKK